ncbi:hypothetical protein PS15m_000062 [Mucor circinelloides]
MYNQSYHHHHSQQRQQHKLPSLHHLMLPSPPPSYHSKLLPQPQPQSSHSYPIHATSNHYPFMPPRAPRMESYEYVAPLKSVPSDSQVLNDASLVLFGTSHSSAIPYQSTLASTPLSSSSSSSAATAPFQDFVLFEPLDQRHSSSSSSSLSSPPCKGKLIPDLNASSRY